MLLTLLLQGRATARELLAAGAEGRASPPARGSWLQVVLLVVVLSPAGALLVWVLVAAGSVLLRVLPARWRGLVEDLLVAIAIAIVCTAEAVLLVVLAVATESAHVAGAFFGSGGLLLIGSLSTCYALLVAAGRGEQDQAPSLAHLGFRTCGRRRWRSLTTVGLLACGVFLVASVEVFRVDPNKDATKRSAGTGGFALYGESAVPVLHDLNDPARREKLAVDANSLAGVNVVQLKVHEGDDASCLNLNRAQRPRLLGVVPARLKGRFVSGGDDPWALLSAPAGEGVVPAIGDADTLQWALRKAVGETMEVTDERGRAVRLKLVDKIGGSILQGNLLIAEGRFRELFPSTSGYRAFLIDAPPGKAAAVAGALSAALEDFGLELTPAARRMAAFAEVQNTYLSIFAALGGLGLVLGSVALGIVVLRNVLERRGELALLRAVGFAKAQIRWVVLCEHWALLVLGLACGVSSAAVAVVPALLTPRAAVPWASWLIVVGGVAVSGVLWTYVAASVSLRGRLLEALRDE